MGTDVILFGWNRSIPGREQVSAEHFQEFVEYLDGLQKDGAIQGFDTVFLNPHGGDLNGFFLIRGETDELDELLAGEEWLTHMTRAGLHLDGSGAVRGVAGDRVMERMDIWRKSIPKT